MVRSSIALSSYAPVVSSSSAGHAAGRATRLHHPYADKCPQLEKTGNRVVDEDNDSKIQLLQEIISDCLLDVNHINPL